MNKDLNDKVAISNDSGDLERLKQLLFKEELKTLNEIKDNIQDPSAYAKEVSKVIAEAIAIRQSKDDTLRKALMPAIESVISSSVKQNPAELATTLFPLMGPAIRKSISEGFRSMLESFNRTIEMSFSFKAIRWRIEAFRTGKPFGEIVLLNTLVYKVEQVLLIHSETGILLQHVAADDVEQKDGDMVSGMLTVIQDFVKDCLMQSDDGGFDSMQTSDRTLIVEKGSRASLALVVRGTLPGNFRNKVRDTLDLIHIKTGDSLVNFTGDLEPFKSVHYLLEDCLEQQFYDDNKKLPLTVKLIPVAIISIIIFLYGFGWYHGKKMHNAIDRLDMQPGLVVNKLDGNVYFGWRLDISRDPLAAMPDVILRNEKINLSKILIREFPMISIDPRIVKLRLDEVIKQPDDPQYYVSYSFNKDTVYLSGSAPISWILDTKNKIASVPGVVNIDTSKLKDPRAEKLQALIKLVDSTIIEFDVGKDIPVDGELVKMNAVADELAEIAKLTQHMGISASLIVYGHADRTGIDRKNYELSERRATTLAAMLYTRGVAMPVATYGFGSQYADNLETENHSSRQIQMKVNLNYMGTFAVNLDKL